MASVKKEISLECKACLA